MSTLLGLALLAALSAAPMRAQSCDCAAASLIGDTVNTLLNSATQFAVNKVVGTGVEIPTGGVGADNLGSAGNVARWKIDFGPDFIRIDFTQGPATYGQGSKFTFSSLDPKLGSGCPGTPVISGIQVSTNKASAPYVSTATFGPHQVVAPFAPASSNVDWNAGEFILIKLQFACEGGGTSTTFDPCCPPWNSKQLQSMLVYQGTGGINAPYTLHFTPTAAFNAQMQAYVAYLHALNPAINSISIKFSLFDGGTGSSSTVGALLAGAFAATWTSGSSTVPGFFAPGLLQVNHWYRVDTMVALNNNIQFFPEKCSRSWVDVRLQVIGSPQRPGPGSAAPALELRLSDGTVLKRPVTAAR